WRGIDATRVVDHERRMRGRQATPPRAAAAAAPAQSSQPRLRRRARAAGERADTRTCSERAQARRRAARGLSPVITRLAPGAPIGQRHRVVRFLAEGSSSDVYEAEELASG